ncbi:MAG TPA: hypothetical protein PKW98_08285 [Candidatus Wallbacteria bacterium]|nr:hypothetical protein [Candidatus Wallbacteria bacterium]
MDREELLKLIENLNSPDNLIRNFSANIFLNIKDESCVAFLYDTIKNSNAYIKSLFLKLIASGKKRSRKKYLLSMLEDGDSSIRAEAAAIIKKSAQLFTHEDFAKTLRSGLSQTRLAALETLIENPDESIKPEIISAFFNSLPPSGELKPFEAALKYFCLHSPEDKNARGRYLALMQEAFKTARHDVLKYSLKYSRFLISETEMLALYRSYIYKYGGEADEAIISSALDFKTPETEEFLSQFISGGEIESSLRRKCIVRLIKSGSEGYITRCLKTVAGCKDQSIKFFAYNALFDIDGALLSNILKELITAATVKSEKIEYLTLLSLAVTKNLRNLQFIIDIYRGAADCEVKSSALEIIYRNNFMAIVPQEFLNELALDIKAEKNAGLKYSAIPLLVKYFSQNHLEAFFAVCRKHPVDYGLFCEAYIKKVKSLDYSDPAIYKFYKYFIAILFENKNIDAITAAAVTAPYRGVVDFIHQYVEALNLNRGGLYAAIVRKVIIAALKNAPDSSKRFLHCAEMKNLNIYISLLKETAAKDSLKALASFFFGGEAFQGVEPAEEARINFALKDAIYFIVKSNILTIFEVAQWPEFENRNFSVLIAGAFISSLKELEPAAGHAYAAFYSKNPALIKFYRAVSKLLSLEDKFCFYNILQKVGGEAALDIINELG